MPTHARAVELKLPEAQPLAELYGIRFDLEDAIDYCNRAIQHRKSQGYQGVDTEQAFVVAAIVTYARCFLSGAREALHPSRLPGLSEHHFASHEFFFTLRTKSVAHSINVFDETRVTVTAAELDGAYMPVTAVHPGRNRLILGAEFAGELHELATAVRESVQVLIREEESRLLAHLQTLPPEVIHRSDLRPAFAPSLKDVAKERPRRKRSPRKAK